MGASKNSSTSFEAFDNYEEEDASVILLGEEDGIKVEIPREGQNNPGPRDDNLGSSENVANRSTFFTPLQRLYGAVQYYTGKVLGSRANMTGARNYAFDGNTVDEVEGENTAISAYDNSKKIDRGYSFSSSKTMNGEYTVFPSFPKLFETMQSYTKQVLGTMGNTAIHIKDGVVSVKDGLVSLKDRGIDKSLEYTEKAFGGIAGLTHDVSYYVVAGSSLGITHIKNKSLEYTGKVFGGAAGFTKAVSGDLVKGSSEGITQIKNNIKDRVMSLTDRFINKIEEKLDDKIDSVQNMVEQQLTEVNNTVAKLAGNSTAFTPLTHAIEDFDRLLGKIITDVNGVPQDNKERKKICKKLNDLAQKCRIALLDHIDGWKELYELRVTDKQNKQYNKEQEDKLNKVCESLLADNFPEYNKRRLNTPLKKEEKEKLYDIAEDICQQDNFFKAVQAVTSLEPTEITPDFIKDISGFLKNRRKKHKAATEFFGNTLSRGVDNAITKASGMVPSLNNATRLWMPLLAGNLLLIFSALARTTDTEIISFLAKQLPKIGINASRDWIKFGVSGSFLILSFLSLCVATKAKKSEENNKPLGLPTDTIAYYVTVAATLGFTFSLARRYIYPQLFSLKRDWEFIISVGAGVGVGLFCLITVGNYIWTHGGMNFLKSPQDLGDKEKDNRKLELDAQLDKIFTKGAMSPEWKKKYYEAVGKTESKAEDTKTPSTALSSIITQQPAISIAVTS